VKAKAVDLVSEELLNYCRQNDSLASFNEDIAEELKKHPSPSRELFAQTLLNFSLIVNEQNVREAISSFPAGFSPGLDGMRPQ
jgi:hypothetical protein